MNDTSVLASYFMTLRPSAMATTVSPIFTLSAFTKAKTLDHKTPTPLEESASL
jgi:hypothetical protein